MLIGDGRHARHVTARRGGGEVGANRHAGRSTSWWRKGVPGLSESSCLTHADQTVETDDDQERGLAVLLLDDCECGQGVDYVSADASLSSLR
jgi:hypothetical protein